MGLGKGRARTSVLGELANVDFLILLVITNPTTYYTMCYDILSMKVNKILNNLCFGGFGEGRGRSPAFGLIGKC